jgi:hypothetical protein
MKTALTILLLVSIHPVLFSQIKTDTAGIVPQAGSLKSPTLDPGSVHSFPFMFNLSTVFFTAEDLKMNKFLGKYGYIQPQKIPVGIRFEIAGMPAGGRMIYSLNAGTIVSRQDISSADISLGIYYRILQSKKWMIATGLAVGEHFDRVVLNGRLPLFLDSLSQAYHTTLSLHRTGLVIEPATKIFWYPFQTKKMRVGIFAVVNYDFDFNSRWRVGYYPHNSGTFKNLRKSTQINTTQESGWVFSLGLSIGI